MKLIDFSNKIRRKVKNVSRMIKYGYLIDHEIKGIDVFYGENKKQYYRVYKGLEKNKYTIFFVHGGGWHQGSPSLYSGVGKFLSKCGYTTVIVGYRLVPKYRYPTQIEDVFTAFRHYIYNTKNVDNIIVGGYSAGSEIACHLVFDTYRQNMYNIPATIIKGFISLSGVLNFLECKSKYSIKLINNYLYKESIKSCNPINLLEPNNIPVLCVHGGSDTLIHVNNSISFISKLKSLNKNAFLTIIPNEDHEYTIDIIRGYGNKYSKYVFDFIEKIDS